MVTVLFCEHDSIYKKLNCDVYDEKRNALNFKGSQAAIHHPPCRLWSRLKAFSTADHYEKYFAFWSIRHVQNNGGVFEHPEASSFFKCAGLPAPGKCDQFGFTIELDQYHFGHKARKRTWLYIVGLPIDHTLLNYKKIPGKPRYVISGFMKGKQKLRKSNATPKKFAKFLVKIVAKINNLKDEKKPKNFN